MPEHVALAEQIQHAAVVDERDRTPADHAHLVLRALSLLEDRRPCGEVLHFDARRKAVEGGRVEVTERSVILQEVGDVLHVRADYPAHELRPPGNPTRLAHGAYTRSRCPAHG
jgi:hypothetical protein